MDEFSPLQILEMHYRYRCVVLARHIADELGIRVFTDQLLPGQAIFPVVIAPQIEPVEITPAYELMCDVIYYAPPVLILGLTSAFSFIEFLRRLDPRS